jgi:glycosyltransferase involved in cell wall biosynthesis
LVKVAHVLSGLEIGGVERAVVRLASRGTREKMDHTLLLFDKPFRSERVDFSPGDLTAWYIQRRPGVDLRFAISLAKLLRTQRTDIVHAHNDTAIFYSALALTIGRLNETSLIGTFRTRPTPGTVAARLLTRWAADRAAEIVAVSQELNDWLVRSGWTRRSATIWNGIDLAEFCPTGRIHPWRAELGIPKGAVVVGHVGRFAPIKRHVDLFEAASRLQSAQPSIQFAFAGNGPLFEQFRRRSLELSNVTMLSNVRDVASFLRSLDIFVLCSDHEGAPQALLEAMACARAIVATRVGGIPHLLDADGLAPAGRLIPLRRADLLAAEILHLARDGELRNRLGRSAWQRVQAFSFDREWTEYAELYAAVSRRSGRRPIAGC